MQNMKWEILLTLYVHLPVTMMVKPFNPIHHTL